MITCDWVPNSNPYTGKPNTAIMAFVEIPKPVRLELVAMVERNQYSDHAEITRDEIKGLDEYLPDLREMHGGSKGHLCNTVSRAKWSDSEKQRGLVYCASGYCVIRPSVCNNWAIVTRTAVFGGTKPTDMAVTIDEYAGPVGYGEFVPLQLLPDGSGQLDEATNPSPAPYPFPYVTLAPVGPFKGPVSTVPEPKAWLVMVVALLGVCLFNRLRK